MVGEISRGKVERVNRLLKGRYLLPPTHLPSDKRTIKHCTSSFYRAWLQVPVQKLEVSSFLNAVFPLASFVCLLLKRFPKSKINKEMEENWNFLWLKEM